MNTLDPAFKDLKSNLKNMLFEGIHAFEGGLRILDVDLEIEEHFTVDMVAKDAKGNPVIVLFDANGSTDLLSRILGTLCRIKKHRVLLERIYKEHGFDFSVPPRILLLSPRFSEEFLELIDFIVPVEMVPYEYSTLRIDDKEYMVFTRRDAEGEGEVRAVSLDKMKGAPAPVESVTAPSPKPEPEAQTPPAAGNTPTSGPSKGKKKGGAPHERFFHEAKKKILRISNEIVENVDGDYSRFKIGDKVLVTLLRRDDGLYVYLGDTSEKRIRIETEDKLNEVLNLIFKRYFTAFSGISK